MTKAAAVYAIFLGIMMIGQWAVFILTGNVPELETEPVRISFHLAAELLTAVMLIGGGAGLLRKKTWAKNLYLTGAGMVLYSMIVSTGYFARQGNVAFPVMFLALIVTGTILTAGMLKENKKEG